MSDLLSRLQNALRDVYAIERELGRGGMATVFLARDLKHGRDVAIKVLHPDLAAAVGLERFRREIQIETQLTHPNILPLYDSGEANGLLFYVMPFIDGESLRARIAREHQLPIDEAIRITCEVADALDYAHRHGLIHRDIKPENILLEDGHAIVADFGIARAVTASSEQKLTESGVTLGTPLYMSPEQAMAQRDLDGRSDQYSLACVLYEMLAGHPPFTGQTAHALIARHALDPVPSLLTVRETVPDEVEAAIVCALAKVPADRFPTVTAFSAALRGTGTFPTGRRLTAGRTAAMRPSRRSPSAVVGASIATAVLIGSAAAWQIWARPTPTASASQSTLDPKRLAVLYLEDESRGGELAHLADGLSEALIEELGKVNALQVISPNGVAQFRGSTTPLDSIAASLRVGTLVRGSVEPTRAGVRVTVRLVDGASGAEIRRAAFERASADLLAMRDTVTQQVADFLRQQLGQEITLQQTRAGTLNVEAWLLTQRAERARKDGEAAMHMDSAAAGERLLATADSLLALAEVADPKWPTPIVMRAHLAARRTRLTRDDSRRSGFIAEGLEHAQRALTSDPRNAAAFEYRGTLRLFKLHFGLAPHAAEVQALRRTAEEDLEQAVALDKSRATAWNTLSYVQYQRHKKVDANLAAQRAYEEDAYLASARDIIWRLYTTSYDLEQFAAASKWCEHGRSRFPDDPAFTECQLWMMTTRDQRPDVPSAWRAVAEIERKMTKPAWEAVRRQVRMLVAVPIARAGLLDSARRVIERESADHPEDRSGELVGREAVVRTLIGDKEEALRLLGLYLTSHPEHREGFVKGNTWWWRSLQEDPRFKSLMGADG